MIERLRFLWSEHESAAHSMSQGRTIGQSYAYSFSANVIEMKELWDVIDPNIQVWKWSMEYKTTLDEVVLRAHGYARTMEAGKLSAENACNRIHAAFAPSDAESARTKVTVLTFAEFNFEDIVTFPTVLEARGFCRGFGDGAGHYGAGMANAYMMPNDSPEMHEHLEEHPDELARALKALENA